MAEDSTTTAEQGTATEPDEQATQQPADLGDPGKKALQEERRKAREATKQLNELQARLKEFEDRDKTELQKLAEAHQTAEQRASTAEQALARYRVATAKGIPAELVDRLQGSTEDELAEDADRLLSLIGARRTPDFDGGARTTAQGAPDMNKLLRQAAGRQ